MTRQELEAYNDAMMATAAEEYTTWLAEQASFEDPDDPTDSDVPIWTAEERFWIEEEELYRMDLADLRAELYSF